MGTVIRNTLLLLAAGLIASPAFGDSDGSFCLSKAEVTRLDLQNKVLQRVLIYENTSLETVD